MPKPPKPEPSPPSNPPSPPAKPPPQRPADGPVRTQMQGEHGDDDLGYDPSRIPVEDIPED
jgi:hypothetical protein